MSRFIKSVIICLIYTFFVIASNIYAQETDFTKPITNNGKKWRIGYVEGGPYSNYQSILKAMTANLMDLGWIKHLPIPDSKDDSETKTLWTFLSTKVQSDYLEFPLDAYFTSQWDDAERVRLKPHIIKRLTERKDIDLVFAFGTWAGQDLANNLHDTPTMVISASNAVRSGIIKSVEDSGFDHIHAFIDPNRSERQLRLFHDITGFKRLGLAYEDDLDGRSYAAVDDVFKLSQELGFNVIECALGKEDTGITQDEIDLVNCYEELAPKIDSIYVTDDSGLNKNNITKLLEPLFKHKVLMFAQTRYDLVENGILMGAGRTDFKSDARFYVETFTKILNGLKVRDLPQKFESPLMIVINLESAKKIGFRFPFDILAGAFEIHETIKKPEDTK